MPMSGINWRQCAEVFGNIGTLLEQTHRRQAVRGVVPDRNPCFSQQKVVSRPGIEPGTFRLRVCCNQESGEITPRLYARKCAGEVRRVRL